MATGAGKTRLPLVTNRARRGENAFASSDNRETRRENPFVTSNNCVSAREMPDSGGVGRFGWGVAVKICRKLIASEGVVPILITPRA